MRFDKGRATRPYFSVTSTLVLFAKFAVQCLGIIADYVQPTALKWSFGTKRDNDDNGPRFLFGMALILGVHEPHPGQHGKCAHSEDCHQRARPRDVADFPLCPRIVGYH